MSKNKKGILLLAVGLFISVIAIGIVIINKTKIDKVSSEDSIYEIIKSDTLTEIIYKTSTEIYKGPSAEPEKVAYITIDDGPSKYTNQILDILKENDVKATFFMIDGNMRRYKEEVKRVIEEGNSLGFHSVSHDIHKLYETPEATLDEFETCNETLYELSGKTSKLIRLPYGSKPYMPEDSYEKLVDSGYLIWDWNLDTLDWKSSTDQIVSNILYYGRERKEIIVLMHEKEQSIEALNNVIKVLKERGYTIMPISEHSNPKNFWQQNLE